MKHRITVLSAAVGAAVLAFGAGAQAQSLQVELSGQVNRAILHADDGTNSELFNVDNDNSGTRFRFKGTQSINPTTKAGVVFEVEYQSNPSNNVAFAGNAGSPSLDERHMDVFFQSGWGKLSLGQGDGAANGGVEVDLSGTTVAHYADVPATGGGIAFRTAAGAAGPAIGSVISDQDFESRYDRLRYDTPSFNGFSIAASLGNKDADDRKVSEFALTYAGKGDFGEIAAALGLSSRERTPTRDGKFNYLKLGYKWGAHALSFDYGMGEDQNAAGDEADAVGFAYVYKATGWAELFAMLRNYSLEQPGVAYEDVRIIMAGTRLKF